jgi:putative Mn2+ efflux pump MntP
VTTVICCVVALVLGRKLGTLLGDRAEILGGCVLIGIGLKALLG